MRTQMVFRPFCAILCACSLIYAQATMTNQDLVKLVKSGLSEEFILNLVDQQGSRLSSDTSSLIELKAGGVNERILTAIVKKNPPAEKLNIASIGRLARAGFSDKFNAGPRTPRSLE